VLHGKEIESQPSRCIIPLIEYNDRIKRKDFLQDFTRCRRGCCLFVRELPFVEREVVNPVTMGFLVP
jgi:hypothetical protein